jgi:hypothetical protein
VDWGRDWEVLLGATGCFDWWHLGGLWADQALVGLGEYPFFAVWRLAVSPLRRVTFFKRQKDHPKR